MALAVIALVLFILGDTTWLILGGVVLWAVGASMGFPLGMSPAADSRPDAAAGVSAVASLGYLANLAGPPIIGTLSKLSGCSIRSGSSSPSSSPFPRRPVLRARQSKRGNASASDTTERQSR